MIRGKGDHVRVYMCAYVCIVYSHVFVCMFARVWLPCRWVGLCVWVCVFLYCVYREVKERDPHQSLVFWKPTELRSSFLRTISPRRKYSLSFQILPLGAPQRKKPVIDVSITGFCVCLIDSCGERPYLPSKPSGLSLENLLRQEGLLTQ